MILVTGASGTVGKAVLKEVARSGAKPRALHRRADGASKAPAGTSAVIADFAKKDTLAAAVGDVESVYLGCSPVADLVQLESNMIEASVAAGVRHIVLSSAHGAGDYTKSFPSWHRKVEDKLKGAGISFTILRPNSFHQNVLTYFAPSIRAQGAFYSSMGNARTSFLDVRDIAVVAAKTLAGREHHGKTYELNGPEALTYAELAQNISKHAARAVQYVDIPADAQRKAMLEQGMPEWQVNSLLDLQGYYTSGKGGGVDPLLQTLPGRPPLPIDRFLPALSGEFCSPQPGACSPPRTRS